MPVKLNSVAFWNREFEKEYRQFVTGKGKTNFSRWLGERFNMASALLPLRGTVLDVGCGLGHFTRYVKAKRPFLKVYGTDCSKVAAIRASEFDKRIRYFISEPNKISTSQKFDSITCLETIEHIDDDEGFIKELKDHLKPGGTLIISTPLALPGKHSKTSEEHVREYYEIEFYNLLKGFFKNVRISKPPTKINREKEWIVDGYYQVAACSDKKLRETLLTTIYY